MAGLVAPIQPDLENLSAPERGRCPFSAVVWNSRLLPRGVRTLPLRRHVRVEFSPTSSAIVVRPLNPAGTNTASHVIERIIPFRYHRT